MSNVLSFNFGVAVTSRMVLRFAYLSLARSWKPLLSEKKMKYRSTRSGTGEYSFEHVLLHGYAPDGGLFLPVDLPKIDDVTKRLWAHLSYPDLVVEIAKLFISTEEIPHETLAEIVKSVLHPGLVQTKELSSGCLILELYHGKTLAFKDLAMSCTAKFLDFFLGKNKRRLNILVSTSGDTGAAAMEAFRASVNVDVFVMYPLGRLSETQELQMTTAAASAANLHLFGLTGTSDDGDEVMHALFADTNFAAKNNLSNVNSINWSRILIQIAHHFYGYFQACPGCDETVEIVCPTGAAGNLSAGTVAAAMGLPIRLISCVNENDFLYRMINQGILSSGPVQQTFASAMDIQVPYNIERILHISSGQNVGLIQTIYNTLAKEGLVQLPSELLTKVTSLIGCQRSDDQMILRTIQRCWLEEKYLICPHTATAVAYHYDTEDGVRSGKVLDEKLEDPLHCRKVCLATASYIKFPEVMEKAGVPIPESSLLTNLRSAPQTVTHLTNKTEWIMVLRQAIESVSDKHTFSGLS